MRRKLPLSSCYTYANRFGSWTIFLVSTDTGPFSANQPDTHTLLAALFNSRTAQRRVDNLIFTSPILSVRRPLGCEAAGRTKRRFYSPENPGPLKGDGVLLGGLLLGAHTKAVNIVSVMRTTVCSLSTFAPAFDPACTLGLVDTVQESLND